MKTTHGKLFEPQLRVNSLIAELRRHPPRHPAEENRELNRLLSTCPKGKGEGIHPWLFRVAGFLQGFPFLLQPRFVLHCLREATRDCRRKVTEQELLDAVNNSNPAKANALTPSGNGSGGGSLPLRDENYRAKAIKAGGINLAKLINCESEIFSPQFTLKLLYPDHPLLCFVYDKLKPGGIATGYWNDPRLRSAFPPLMVPNPLLAEWGYTKSIPPTRSERALSNVGPRRYLILDFDSGSRDEQAAIIWYLRQQWQKQHVPLVMVLDSGRRSLHGWFDVRHLEEPEIWKLCRQAYRLRADDATFGKSQLVRVPGALRPDTGKLQRVYYYEGQNQRRF
jgi:hypothetical protein